MPSAFAWLDHDESERRKMLEVVNLFRERGTVDELGFGTIRDAFADYFFPGTSTLQTRARYFLFIPWIYLKLEQDKVASAQVDQQARRRSAEVANALKAGGEPEAAGVIGVQAGERLLRPPSVLYWSGLRRWGIRVFSGSLDQYHLSFDGMHGDDRRELRSDDGEGELVLGRLRNWHGGLPEGPADLFEKTTFSLTGDEARYLQERILASVPDSLLAHLTQGQRRIRRVEAPWLYPQFDQLPREMRDRIEQSRRFSLLAVGAQVLYNLMLAERAESEGLRDADLIDRYRARLVDWQQELHVELAAFRGWNRQAFWALVLDLRPSLPAPARRFAEAWMAAAIEDPKRLAERADVRQLITSRERTLKGGLARMQSRRALERWSGASGLSRLTFRWPEGRTMAADILDGLAPGAGSNA